MRRIKQLEDECAALQKQVTNHKQEEEALLNEMEVTGQAFEDMKEQNLRLIQQLREKDDANFKLLSDKIRCNAVRNFFAPSKPITKILIQKSFRFFYNLRYKDPLVKNEMHLLTK